MRPLLITVLGTLILARALLAAPPPEEAIRLRNEGLAHLENEQPGDAERVFAKLTELRPRDPLGWANLAIARLRQQMFTEAMQAVDEALDRSKDDPRLLAIRGEIEHWGGDSDAALATYRRAARDAPGDLEIQHGLYRLATSSNAPDASAAADEALDRMARLRPENLVVLLQRGLRARERGDRATTTASFLRVRELLWQAPDGSDRLIEQVLGALEVADLEGARVPALRLSNLLKVTAMHREGQRELSPGIQGVPLTRLSEEPPATTWGEAVAVRFRGRRLGEAPTVGRALAVADFDGDDRPDIARLTGSGEETRLEMRWAAEGWATAHHQPAPGLRGLLHGDLDNDGRLDLVGYAPGAVHVWRGVESGFEEASASFGVSGGATAAALLDFDIEGDLDLALGRASGTPPVELYLNDLAGPLRPVGASSLPPVSWRGVRDVVASDLDRDGDLDLVAAHDFGIAWLDNLRQGQFVDRSPRALAQAIAPSAIVTGDLDNDGYPDVVAAGTELAFYRNLSGEAGRREQGFERWSLSVAVHLPGQGLAAPVLPTPLAALEVLDLDNDGRLDWVVAGPGGVVAATRTSAGFAVIGLKDAPPDATALAAADFDGDGDLDVVTAGASGLHLLDNEGGNANRWLAVRLRGLDKGNSKNNLFGLGSALEVRSGSAYQFREARGDVTHFGLGSVARPDLLRVVWNNGVPQNRLAPETRQTVVEEQVLKGSCPFLYAWDGESVRFVSDLLWGAPAGLPLAPGVWAGADPDELVKVEGAAPRSGRYDLRITEELWEAAFFDHVRLWVVDHPAGVETASALRILPGASSPQEVRGTRDLRPPVAALDARGVDVTWRVTDRDEIYADGWEPSRYQGVARDTWSFAFDLGEAPARPVRLHLDGWIFPSDASLNLALAQRAYAPVGPRLEVETPDGWQVLIEAMGFPAGKTKTMVIDTPPLPPGSRHLRIVSSMWLSWDRIAWSVRPADDEPRIVARLLPDTAELRFRGFSQLIRRAPNAPHAYDYAQRHTQSPWLPFPGRYTRYGDVRELLAAPDDRSVILAAGDEMALTFDASHLPPPADGWVRTVFLESHGWDKDADRNTWAPHEVEPLPFRAMSGYPYGPGETFPDGPLYREYRERWLTREVLPDPIGSRLPQGVGSAAPPS